MSRPDSSSAALALNLRARPGHDGPPAGDGNGDRGDSATLTVENVDGPRVRPRSGLPGFW
jgi:hypothetical protein